MGAETNAFEPRGVPAPTMLADARVELHWAAQIVAAVGRALIAAAPDESQTSLEWLEAERSLVGGATPGAVRDGVPAFELRERRAITAGECPAVRHWMLRHFVGWHHRRHGTERLGCPAARLVERPSRERELSPRVIARGPAHAVLRAWELLACPLLAASFRHRDAD